jgi:hypothetical protein
MFAGAGLLKIGQRDRSSGTYQQTRKHKGAQLVSRRDEHSFVLMVAVAYARVITSAPEAKQYEP